jgi:hypothetical protein
MSDDLIERAEIAWERGDLDVVSEALALLEARAPNEPEAVNPDKPTRQDIPSPLAEEATETVDASDTADAATKELASDPWHGNYDAWGSREPIAKEGKWWAQGKRREIKPERVGTYLGTYKGRVTVYTKDLDPHFSYLDRLLAKTRESAELKRLIKGIPIQVIPLGKRGEAVPKEFECKPYLLKEKGELWALKGRDWRLTPIKYLYIKHCVICDGPGYPPSLINPEVTDIKITPVSLDQPTGQFICSHCMRRVRKQNARLEIPKVENEVDERGRIRISDVVSPPTLVGELQEECPGLYSALMPDESEEEHLDGYRSLGDGGFWRKGTDD